MNLKDFKVSNVPVNVNRLRIYNDSRHLLDFDSPQEQREAVTTDAPTEVNDHFTAEPPLGTVVTPVTAPVTNNDGSPTQIVQLKKRGRPRKQINQAEQTVVLTSEQPTSGNTKTQKESDHGNVGVQG